MSDYNPNLWNAMQENKPFKVYRKTILGKVYVTVRDPFTNQPVGILLTGDPQNSDNAYVYVYDVREDEFFKRMNAQHFREGNIIAVNLKEDTKEEVETLEQASDEKVKELVSGKVPVLRAALQKTNSEALVMRMLNFAKELDRSEKTIQIIEARLSEIQGFVSEE